MSILIDSSKEFVTIQIWYVEERNQRNGISQFHFIRNKNDNEFWRSQGYIPITELEQKQQLQKPEAPGVALKPEHDPQKVIKVLKTWWSQMSWREANDLYSRCVKRSTDANGEVRTELDAIAFRDQKLKTCLKRWDYQENGVEVPCTPTTIDSLYPEVAQELITQFESLTEPSDEQLKNLSGQLAGG